MSSRNQCHILDLNDDCFYHIYTFVPTIDWCSLRETCTRFRAISDYCFDRRSATFELRQISDDWYNLGVSEVKRVLRHFGRFMKTLTINQKNFAWNVDCNVLMLFVDRYCQSLLDLKLVNFNLSLSTIVQCNRLFSTLQRLVIDQWDDEESFTGVLAKCSSLTELELIRLFNIAGDCLAHSRIESLQSFKMSGCCDISFESIKSFFTINSQLTQIKLFNLQFRDGHTAHSILEDVANTLPKVEVLSLHFNITFIPNLLPVVDMNSLKKFEASLMYVVDDIVNQVLRGLAVRNNIEDLHLAQFKCTDESIRLLSAIKSLRTLTLTETYELDGDMCTKLASGIKNLDEIHIVECKNTSFNEVKEFCVHLPNLKRIVFNRADDADPSITQEIFSSLVKIRKNQATKEVLLIFLNDDDLREIENEFIWGGMIDTLAEQRNLLKLVPLEKEHRSTVFEYGSGFMDRTAIRKSFNSMVDDEDESYLDDYHSYFVDDWQFG